ncbi:hypothetical protein ACEN9F_27135 [Duganella sp. CT11-25]|jgi:hypothetical protein|uniref:hypothetical protein n=1 Tax=unclassified Duganella TaxID=2636909 RepID=UPI0039B11D81
MNILKPALAAAFLLGALLSSDAWAQGRGGHGGHGGHWSGNGHAGPHAGHGHGYHHHGRGFVGGGVIIGAPLIWPRRWYGDPFYDNYYYPGYYLTPGDGQTLYYCNSPRGYYPNVQVCRVPWRTVISTVVPPP